MLFGQQKRASASTQKQTSWLRLFSIQNWSQVHFYWPINTKHYTQKQNNPFQINSSALAKAYHAIEQLVMFVRQ